MLRSSVRSQLTIAASALFAIATVLTLSSCDRDADVASHNLSVAADNFEINRRVVFYNGVTGDYILELTGLCAIGNYDTNKRMSVTCKVGPNSYKKHYLGLSDNVTFFAEQIEPAPAGTYMYRVVFKPTVIVPAIELR